MSPGRVLQTTAEAPHLNGVLLEKRRPGLDRGLLGVLSDQRPFVPREGASAREQNAQPRGADRLDPGAESIA